MSQEMRKRLRAVWVAGVAALGWQQAAWGQTAGAAGAGLVREMSLQDYIAQGGVAMYILGAMSVAGVALIIYLFIVLRRSQIVPESLRRDVLGSLERGVPTDARTACTYKPCAFAEVTVAALDSVEPGRAPDPAQLKDAVEGEGSRQGMLLQNQTQYLFDIAVLSPMVGLLGTVFGMIHAFSAVAMDAAKAKPALLANGVAEALVATAAGLIVGIPTMGFYAFFRNRAAGLIAELEVASGQVMNVLLRKKG